MKALVTGCAGFIGSHLTESLLNDGHEVVGVDCFNDNYGRAQKLRNLESARQWSAFDFVPVDLSRGDLGGLMEDCSVVFHMAAEPGVRPSWGKRFEAYVRNNVSATQMVLEAARTVGVERVVYASSSSIYGQAETMPTTEETTPKPFSPYGVTKLCAEQLCDVYYGNHGLGVVSLRFFTVFGPRQRPDMAFSAFCTRALRREVISVFGDGKQTRDFSYVGDVVSAVRAAGTKDAALGNVYNIGGGSRVSVNDALEIIEGLLGEPLKVDYLETQAGDVRDTGADTTRARRDLDFSPQTDVSTGIEAEFRWAEEMVKSS